MPNRKERLRKIFIKKDYLKGKRRIEKFLGDKISFNEYFKEKISNYSDLKAVTDEYNNVYMTYEQMENQISEISSRIQLFGIKKDDFICIFSENNGRWICTEQSVMR